MTGDDIREAVSTLEAVLDYATASTRAREALCNLHDIAGKAAAELDRLRERAVPEDKVGFIVDEYRPGGDGNRNAWYLVGEQVVDALHFKGYSDLSVNYAKTGLMFRARKLEALAASEAQAKGGEPE